MWGRLSVTLVVLLAAYVVTAKVRRVGDLAPGIVLALPQLIELTFLGVGAWMIGRGWPRREGRTAHCSACGFEHVRAEDRLLPQCPECGHLWSYFGGLSKGRPITSKPLLIAGSLCVGMMVGLLGVRTIAPAIFLRPVPTSVLIQHATQLPGYDPQGENAWIELGFRKLTPSEERSMAASLLDRRLRQRWLPDRAAMWLSGAVKRGVGGEEFSRRFYEEMIALSLDLPDEANADTIFNYRITALARGVNPDGGIGFFVEGMWVEGGTPIMSSRSDKLALPSSGEGEVERGYIPPLPAGEHTVVLKGWIVMYSNYSARPLTWTSGGTAILGDGVFWSQPITLRKTVKINPTPP